MIFVISTDGTVVDLDQGELGQDMSVALQQVCNQVTSNRDALDGSRRDVNNLRFAGLPVRRTRAADAIGTSGPARTVVEGSIWPFSLALARTPPLCCPLNA
jgi:hypothetical protein